MFHFIYLGKDRQNKWLQGRREISACDNNSNKKTVERIFALVLFISWLPQHATQSVIAIRAQTFLGIHTIETAGKNSKTTPTIEKCV